MLWPNCDRPHFILFHLKKIVSVIKRYTHKKKRNTITTFQEKLWIMLDFVLRSSLLIGLFFFVSNIATATFARLFYWRIDKDLGRGGHRPQWRHCDPRRRNKRRKDHWGQYRGWFCCIEKKWGRRGWKLAGNKIRLWTTSLLLKMNRKKKHGQSSKLFSSLLLLEKNCLTKFLPLLDVKLLK